MNGSVSEAPLLLAPIAAAPRAPGFSNPAATARSARIPAARASATHAARPALPQSARGPTVFMQPPSTCASPQHAPRRRRAVGAARDDPDAVDQDLVDPGREPA